MHVRTHIYLFILGFIFIKYLQIIMAALSPKAEPYILIVLC
uniref:Uncharacterized protein n=1 Tax=Rhizophora mucronata TaxID=61149 RepID=A0A2P2PM80_RHIMU